MTSSEQRPPNDPLINEPEWVLPFEYMAIGESFFIPTVKPAVMTTTIIERAKAVKIRVRVFTTSKDGCMGVRVWRLS